MFFSEKLKNLQHQSSELHLTTCIAVDKSAAPKTGEDLSTILHHPLGRTTPLSCTESKTSCDKRDVENNN